MLHTQKKETTLRKKFLSDLRLIDIIKIFYHNIEEGTLYKTENFAAKYISLLSFIQLCRHLYMA